MDQSIDFLLGLPKRGARPYASIMSQGQAGVEPPLGSGHMHMNHVNLCVADVAKSRAFFERYFGFRLLVEKGADTFVGLVDDGGMVLAISNFHHVDKVEYPPIFHVGFIVDSDEEVNAVHKRLTADGLEPGKRMHFHGAWTFYVEAPGGGTVEVAHQGPGFD